jgi:hypothetical protein
MPYEMFLYLNGIPGEKEPVIIRVLAFSLGCTTETDVGAPPHPRAWNVKEVADWLRKSNLQSFVLLFEEHEISGKELLSIQIKHLKEMKISTNDIARFITSQQQLKSKWEPEERPTKARRRRGIN